MLAKYKEIILFVAIFLPSLIYGNPDLSRTFFHGFARGAVGGLGDYRRRHYYRPPPKLQTTLDRGIADPRGCYMQTIKVPTLNKTGSYLETLQFICPILSNADLNRTDIADYRKFSTSQILMVYNVSTEWKKSLGTKMYKIEIYALIMPLIIFVFLNSFN